MESIKRTNFWIIALSLVALTWGTSYAIIKDALNGIMPFQLMSMRFGFSTILLACLFGNHLKNLSKKDIYHNCIIGIFMFCAFVTLVTGISFTTASKQSFLVGSYVLIVPLLAWAINKKKPDIFTLSGAILATIGIGLLTLNSTFNINKGDLISIFCALSFACHMICIEYFNKETDPIASTIIQFAVTSFLFIILTGTFESFNIKFTPKLFNAISYLVVVTTVIAFAVQNAAQKYISSTSTALILTLESAFGGIFAILYLKETMTAQMIVGCIIIFIGIVTEETKFKLPPL